MVQGERGEVEIPPGAFTLNGFRQWTRSDGFPDHARIDFVAGLLYVDLTMQRQQSHGLPKTEIVTGINLRNRSLDYGEVTSDVTRVVLPDADTSCEPDVVLVSYDAIESGRVTETAAKDGSDGVEFVGPPELAIEVVSPSSVEKDTGRLLDAYFVGGVTEYWLVDCRDDDAPPTFMLHRRGDDVFEAVPPDADGFAASAVLGKSYRLTRTRGRLGRWQYRLEER